MDSQQAKEILLSYRPDVDDAKNPSIVAALQQLERDSELASWFERLQAADDVIRRQLREAPVPPGLKQRILAEQKIARPDFGWRKPLLVAAAAAVIVLGVLSAWTFYRNSGGGLNTYRAQMVGYITSSYNNVFVKASSFDELRQVLASRQWPSDFVVPSRLQSVSVVGGGTMEWNNHKVALACMKEGRRGLWLFVIDESALPGMPGALTPRIEQVDGTPTAVWSQGGKSYLFAVQGDEAFLRKFLPRTM